MRVRRAAFAALVAVAVSGSAAPIGGGSLAVAADAAAGDGPRKVAAVEYATVKHERLLADVYLPDGVAAAGPRPVIVFIHGGGWMTGYRQDVPKEMVRFTDRGFVVVSIDYRCVQGNRFLDNVRDVKAAIRFLRANAEAFSIDPSRIALVGFAAGGHLAALAGLAGGPLEGRVGDHVDTSSAVHALVSFQGPMNLATMLAQPTPRGKGKHRVAVELLLGGPPEERQALAFVASPVSHVRHDAPPILLVYGADDDQVPQQQGREMADAYARQGAAAELVVIDGAQHKSLLRFDDRRQRLLADFLDRQFAAMDAPAP